MIVGWAVRLRAPVVAEKGKTKKTSQNLFFCRNIVLNFSLQKIYANLFKFSYWARVLVWQNLIFQNHFVFGGGPADKCLPFRKIVETLQFIQSFPSDRQSQGKIHKKPTPGLKNSNAFLQCKDSLFLN